MATRRRIEREAAAVETEAVAETGPKVASGEGVVLPGRPGRDRAEAPAPTVARSRTVSTVRRMKAAAAWRTLRGPKGTDGFVAFLGTLGMAAGIRRPLEDYRELIRQYEETPIRGYRLGRSGGRTHRRAL